MHTQCILVVQVIGIQWTKRSRGAPAATLRNAVPERLALPERAGAVRSGSLLHRVSYGERRTFRSPVVEHCDFYADIRTPLLSPIDLRLEGDSMQVQFHGPTPIGPYVNQDQHPAVWASFMGAPGRIVPRRPFALRPGEWGQIRYMGRHQGWEDQWYEKWVYNIGWFSKVSPRIFLDTEPRHRFDSMPNVW